MKAAVQLIVGRWSIRCFANELGIKYRTFRCYAEKASNIDCIDNMNFTPKQCLLWGILCSKRTRPEGLDIKLQKFNAASHQWKYEILPLSLYMESTENIQHYVTLTSMQMKTLLWYGDILLKTFEVMHLSKATSFHKTNINAFSTKLDEIKAKHKSAQHEIYNVDEMICLTLQRGSCKDRKQTAKMIWTERRKLWL